MVRLRPDFPPAKKYLSDKALDVNAASVWEGQFQWVGNEIYTVVGALTSERMKKAQIEPGDSNEVQSKKLIEYAGLKKLYPGFETSKLLVREGQVLFSILGEEESYEKCFGALIKEGALFHNPKTNLKMTLDDSDRTRVSYTIAMAGSVQAKINVPEPKLKQNSKEKIVITDFDGGEKTLEVTRPSKDTGYTYAVKPVPSENDKGWVPPDLIAKKDEPKLKKVDIPPTPKKPAAKKTGKPHPVHKPKSKPKQTIIYSKKDTVPKKSIDDVLKNGLQKKDFYDLLLKDGKNLKWIEHQEHMKNKSKSKDMDKT
jgi:hypothetical protein